MRCKKKLREQGNFWLSTVDLAKRWGVSEGTLRNYRSAGRGPKFIKISGRGGPVRYSLDEVRKWELRKSKARSSRLILANATARR